MQLAMSDRFLYLIVDKLVVACLIPPRNGAILSTLEHLYKASVSDVEDFELCAVEWPNARQSIAESDPFKNASS